MVTQKQIRLLLKKDVDDEDVGFLWRIMFEKMRDYPETTEQQIEEFFNLEYAPDALIGWNAAKIELERRRNS